MLLFSLRNQMYKDTTGERALLFRKLLEQMPVAKLLYSLIDHPRASWVAVIAAIVYGGFARIDLSLVSVEDGSGWAFGNRANEFSAIRKYEIFQNKKIQTVHATADARFSWPMASFFISAYRAFHLLRRFRKKGIATFVLFRISRTLFFYSQLQKKFHLRKGQLIFSTDGNPHGNAIMGLTGQTGIKTIYMAHASDSIQPLRIRCDHAVFFGRFSYEAALKNGSQIKTVNFLNFSQDFKKIMTSEIKQVGIFLSKDFNSERLNWLTNQIFEKELGSSIIIRLHPDSLMDIAIPADSRIRISRKATVEEDLKNCDMVFGGNSTVLLECLLHGVPSFYWEKLDRYSDFRLPSIQQGVVGTLDSLEKNDLINALTVYSSLKWREKFGEIFNLV